MADEHLEKGSVLLFMREMQIKTAPRFSHILEYSTLKTDRGGPGRCGGTGICSHFWREWEEPQPLFTHHKVKGKRVTTSSAGEAVEKWGGSVLLASFAFHQHKDYQR